ncbi:MAG: uracil-DNA glycosylase, partial [Thermoplasmata archaeon]
MPRDPNCTKCYLHKTALNRCIYGSGNPRSKIMIVGIAPMTNEDMKNKVFVGPSGQMLNKVLTWVGLDRESVYVTNIVKCFVKSNTEPEKEAIEACAEYFVDEIDTIRPSIVVACGKVPYKALTNRNEILKWMKSISKVKYMGREIYVTPMPHPRSALTDSKHASTM